MARFRFENRVKESSNDTGTGDFSLGGAQKTYRAFSAVCNDQDTFPYTIAHDAADDREVGIGKYDANNDRIVRQTVLESSNNDSKVDFGSGSKVVAMTLPKERTPALDATPNAGDVPVSDGNEHQPSSNAPDKIIANSGLDTRGDVVDDQGNTVYDYSAQQVTDGVLPAEVPLTDEVNRFTKNQVFDGSQPQYDNLTNPFTLKTIPLDDLDANTEALQETVKSQTNPDGSRLDVVWNWGYNVGPQGQKVNTNEHQWKQALETYYKPDTSPAQVEWYYSFADPSGNGIRPFFIVGDFDGPEVRTKFSTGVFEFHDDDTTAPTSSGNLRAKFELVANRFVFLGSNILQDTNDQTFIQQKDSGGTVQGLLGLRSDDLLDLYGRIYNNSVGLDIVGESGGSGTLNHLNFDDKDSNVSKSIGIGIGLDELLLNGKQFRLVGSNRTNAFVLRGDNLGLGIVTPNFGIHQTGGEYAVLGAPGGVPTASNMENQSYGVYLDTSVSPTEVKLRAKDGNGNTTDITIGTF